METTAVTGMEAVTGAVGTVLEMTGTVLTTITDNPVLVVMLAFSFVGAGIAVFKKLTNATMRN